MADPIKIQMNIRRAFGNLYRKRCVLIAVENANGDILLGSKPAFFPPTITRLLGGGVDDNEDILQAAVRELEEELSVNVAESELHEVAVFEVSATDEEGNQFETTTYLYHANIANQAYAAGDDVKGIDLLNNKELLELADRYANLSDTLWYKGVEGEYSWSDYGKMYSVIHKVAGEYLAANSSR